MDRLITYRHNHPLAFRAICHFAVDHPDVRVDFFMTRFSMDAHPDNMIVHSYRDWNDDAFRSFCYKWNSALPATARMIIVGGNSLDWGRFMGRTVALVKWSQVVELDELGFFLYPPLTGWQESEQIARQLRFFLLFLPNFTYNPDMGEIAGQSWEWYLLVRLSPVLELYGLVRNGESVSLMDPGKVAMMYLDQFKGSTLASRDLLEAIWPLSIYDFCRANNIHFFRYDWMIDTEENPALRELLAEMIEKPAVFLAKLMILWYDEIDS